MKPNLAFTYQEGTLNLMVSSLQSGQTLPQPAFLSVISHQIMIHSLWKGYSRFSYERNLIFLSFMAGAIHTQLQYSCSEKKECF